MRYQVQQRLFSLGTTFEIGNEAGQTILRAKGAVMAFGHDITVASLGGHEFVRIRQKLLSWRPTYHLSRGGLPIATVTRRLAWRPTYRIDLTGGSRLGVTGSFAEHEYRVSGPDGPVATVSRAVWSIRDHYGVEVLDPALEAVVLGAVIAIDCDRSSGDWSN